MIRQLHTLCASFCFCAILLKLLSSRYFMPFSICWTPCEKQNYCLFSHDSFWMNTLVHVLKGLQWWKKLFGAAWSSSVWPFKKLFKTSWLSSALPAWAQCVLASQASHRTRTCRSNNRTDSTGKSMQFTKWNQRRCSLDRPEHHRYISGFLFFRHAYSSLNSIAWGHHWKQSRSFVLLMILFIQNWKFALNYIFFHSGTISYCHNNCIQG